MKSIPQSLNPGNLKMHGKKTQLMRCGCCEAQNFKHRELDREHEKEIRRANESQAWKYEESESRLSDV